MLGLFLLQDDRGLAGTADGPVLVGVLDPGATNLSLDADRIGEVHHHNRQTHADLVEFFQCDQRSGRSAMDANVVKNQSASFFAKVEVAGSNPVSRS